MTGSNLTAQTTAEAYGYVRATSGVVSGGTSITVVPAALDHIDMSPSSLVNTVASSQRQFSAVGRDVYNNSISGLTFTWSTNIGNVSGSGLFKAQSGSGGLGYVNASSGGKMVALPFP